MKNLTKITTALILLFTFSINAQVEEKKECIEGDCKNGYGVFAFKYGDIYKGNWKDGKQNGEGTWINADKSKTIGNWNDNFQDGIFKVYYANGEFSHEEIWVKGKGLLKPGCESGDCENGWGTYIWEDGNKYEGNWKDGKQHGQGNLYWFSGDKYFGDWKNNIMDGIGTYIWKEGTIYKGEYTNGKMHGKGKLYSNQSTLIRTGNWVNDEYLVGETGCISGNCENGKGTYLWEDGNKYEGEWKNSQMNGTGILYLENGEIYHNGQWKDHQKIE